MNDKATSGSGDKRRALNKNTLGIKEGLPLEASQGDLESLRADIQRLMDMEAIKQLKYAYFRCVDTANMEEMATLCHDDMQVHFIGGSYEWKLGSKQEYLDIMSVSFGKQSIGHHNGHHPEIQMLSETEATAIWYLADNMWTLNHNRFTTGTALYWDRYRKVDGRWLIAETRYERLYEINTTLEEKPSLASHYLATHGSDPV